MKLAGFPYEMIICGEDGTPINERKGGYAALAHGEHYKIKLVNDDDRRAKVTLTADGAPIGTWVIPAHNDGRTFIDRPEEVAKLLTFFKDDSDEARAALLNGVSAVQLGVIQASFVREEAPVYIRKSIYDFGNTYRDSPVTFRGGDEVTRSFGGGATRSVRGLGAGGTGLSGVSQQTFGKTIFTADPTFEPVVISLRLAHDPKRNVMPDVQPLSGHRPRQNIVPPPLGGKRYGQ